MAVLNIGSVIILLKFASPLKVFTIPLVVCIDRIKDSIAGYTKNIKKRTSAMEINAEFSNYLFAG